MNALKPLAYHIDLGPRLAPLPERGVMIVGSGNVVHNLRRIQWDNPDGGEDWARRFDDSVADRMAAGPGALLEAAEHPDFASDVPTPDHFISLLYTAGLAAAARGGAPARVRGVARGWRAGGGQAREK